MAAKFPLGWALCLLAFFSCSGSAPSALSLEAGGGRFPLSALNKNARSSRIEKPQKSPYAYFAFDESFAGVSLGAASALEVEAALLPASSAPSDGVILLGFLFQSDFEARGKDVSLKKDLAPRRLARIAPSFAPAGRFAVSLAFPPAGDRVAGFLVYSPVPLACEAARIIPAEIGFDPASPIPRQCFSWDGGEAGGWVASRASGSLTGIAGGGASGGDTEGIQGEEPLRGFLAPLTVDPSVLLGRPKPRLPDYELYAWDLFPEVLFFDTKDYAVQDDFFKRLAFFAEKKGFRGRLAPDAEIAALHGYNAHDYRAETLAAFFSLAAETGFPLNQREILLRTILLANGIITQAGGDGGASGAAGGAVFAPGRGAVISISRESPDYLRRQFIVHEGFHGIYFTQEKLRAAVDRVYAETDPLCVKFLVGYFDVTPALSYDVSDAYLVRNEFMAYLLQQPVSAAAEYFSGVIANYTYINRYHPDLAEYVRTTRARGLVESAEKLSRFIKTEWGLEAGRVWK